MTIVSFEAIAPMGAIVYLKTDPEQRQYIITGFQLYPGGFMYCLSHGNDSLRAYEIELSNEKTFHL